jgi:flagellar biosynthesis/type III secretory pathway protein FliH
MSNNKQSSVEWLSNQIYELFEQYSEGNFDRITLNKLVLKATEQAKEMEKQQKEKSYQEGFKEGYKSGM